MILPLASLLFFWIDQHGCLLDIVCNSFSVACRRGLYLHQRGELLFLEGTLWGLWGLSGNKPSSVLLPELAQGADGHDNGNSPDCDASASYPLSCWAWGTSSTEATKLYFSVLPQLISSSPFMGVFVFSGQEINQTMQGILLSFYSTRPDKTNQSKSVKHKQRSRGFVITLTIKSCFNHRALNSSSDLLR